MARWYLIFDANICVNIAGNDEVQGHQGTDQQYLSPSEVVRQELENDVLAER